MANTKSTSIRIHTHFGRIVLEGADGSLSPEHAAALARELIFWAGEVGAKKHPLTRLVPPQGDSHNEADGATAPKFI